MKSSAGSIMALSGDLKSLCLGESLNIYATSRFTFENELYSYQGKANSRNCSAQKIGSEL